MYKKRVEKLFKIAPSFQKVGVEGYHPGLEKMVEFCHLMGNPQNSFSSIHIAGTNGKGSVCAFLQCILSDSGLKTGKFISPNMIDVTERISIDGKDVPLLKKEFDILLYFMQRPGHIVDKAVLAEAVWGDHADQSDDFQYVYAQMKNLRRKLSEAGADIEIKSVYGFGYKLLLP